MCKQKKRQKTVACEVFQKNFTHNDQFKHKVEKDKTKYNRKQKNKKLLIE